MRAVGSIRRPDRVTFRGQYTGQEYQVRAPKAVPRDSGAASCPNCQPAKTRDSGAEKAATRRNAPAASSPKQRSQRAGSPAGLPPGLWYLAATPPAAAPPAFTYVSSVPVMPYPPATMYYAPPAAPTSASSGTACGRAARGPRHSVQLDPGDLEELSRALSQAVRAAESVRSTSRQMSRSLSADLRQVRGLRGSCLF